MVRGKAAKSEKGTRRTFTGCWSCRSRGVKCDEKSPSCSQCLKHGNECAGYRQNLVWVDSENFKKYSAGGRRLIELERWTAYPVPIYSQVDDVIASCDLDPIDENTTYVSCPPFGVFRSSSQSKQEEVPEVPDITYSSNIDDDSPARKIEDISFQSLVRSPRLDTRLSIQDIHVFHHYARNVAPELMPFPDARNPWTNYPALALHYSAEGQKGLFNAVMAHSAIALANKGQDRDRMLMTGTRFYVLAIKNLREMIGKRNIDYVSLLTTILTLMFTEMYMGNSTTWRSHLDGAWQLMLQQQDLQFWGMSDQAWFATQSFCLLRIVSESAGLLRTESPIGEYIMERLLSNNLFGLTMGASSSLMRCISDITKLSQASDSFLDPDSRDRDVADILKRLESCQESDIVSASPLDTANDMITRSGELLGKIHMRAFIAAAFIYFYQQLHNSPPKSLQNYVMEVLDNLKSYIGAGGINFTFWPAFIAATEAYTVDAKSAMVEIFSHTNFSVSHNRDNIVMLLHEVWRARETTAAKTGLDLSEVTINWKAIMQDLKLDILLL